MATTSQQCIKFAQQCMDIAEEIPKTRDVLIKMAQAWIEIADALGPSKEIDLYGNAPLSDRMQ